MKRHQGIDFLPSKLVKLALEMFLLTVISRSLHDMCVLAKFDRIESSIRQNLLIQGWIHHRKSTYSL